MTGGDRKARPRPASLGDPYLPGDPIPVPEALERDSDSMWALWQRTHRAQEERYAETVPASMPVVERADPYAPTAPVQLSSCMQAPITPRPVKPPTIHDAMTEVRRNNRVCPSPARWRQLYDMLPGRAGTRPTPPLLGPSWEATPSLSKRMCLREHLAWAEAMGTLPQVLAFLKELPEQEWHHMGD